jgi:hypothetical protein
VDKVGTIYGDLWSEVRNRHSRRLYLILTLPDLGSDDWVTHLFALVETKVLFGLLAFTALDFHRPLVTFRRKTQEEATHLHAQLRGMVTQEKEDAWCAFLPAPTPPEGDTEAAQPRRSTPGGTARSCEAIKDKSFEARHATCLCGGRCPRPRAEAVSFLVRGLEHVAVAPGTHQSENP